MEDENTGDPGNDADVRAAFADVRARMLDEHPGDEPGTMFASPGLRLPNRKFYAFCPGHGVIVKLPADRVSALVADGEGLPCAPSGRRMREWVELTCTDPDVLLDAVREAREFVERVTT